MFDWISFSASLCPNLSDHAAIVTLIVYRLPDDKLARSTAKGALLDLIVGSGDHGDEGHKGKSEESLHGATLRVIETKEW